MSNVKISALPAATTPLTGTELVPLVQSGVTSQVAVSNIKTAPAGSNTQVQFNNASAFGASASLTWDGTSLTATKLAGAHNGTVGATTPSTGAFTTLSATGKISTTQGGTSIDGVAIVPAVNTDRGLFRITNLSSDTLFGAQGSAASIITVGSSNYDACIRSTSGIAFSADGGSNAQMRLNSTGAIALAGAVSATGVGITFPATQSASTNANTLDDYEEGSWTPVDSSGASLSFTVGSAIYIKIGRFVLVQFYFTFPVTASGANNLIGGLPFTVASSNNYCYGVGRLGTPSAIGTMQANANGTDIQIYNSSNGIYANSQLSNGNVLASVSYITT